MVRPTFLVMMLLGVLGCTYKPEIVTAVANVLKEWVSYQADVQYLL